MNMHRSRTEERGDSRTADEQGTPAASGGTTAGRPERPAMPPSVPGRSADTGSGTGGSTGGTDDRTVTPPAAPVTAAGLPGTQAPPAAEEIDRLSRRMERAVGGFVDDPRRAVREADAVLDEATRRLTRVLEERRNALRGSWHGDNGAKTGTEELRVALAKYRDMTRELLNVS